MGLSYNCLIRKHETKLLDYGRIWLCIDGNCDILSSMACAHEKLQQRARGNMNVAGRSSKGGLRREAQGRKVERRNELRRVAHHPRSVATEFHAMLAHRMPSVAP